jgi:membrane protease YdiL (CAAX protease family)
MFLFLWSAAIYCWAVLRFQHHEHLKGLWKWDAVTWENMKPILTRWVFASIGMLAFIYFYDPERVFFLVKERPQIIPFLLLMYPLLSALPQEFIFCSFFFERYKAFFKTQTVMIIASAVVFAYAHVLFINIVAPSLSLIAGVIFAMTYAKTKSLALVTIEHGLYGNVLFLVGLGWYFYGGAVAQ